VGYRKMVWLELGKRGGGLRGVGCGVGFWGEERTCG